MLFSCMNHDVHECKWYSSTYSAPTCFKEGKAVYKCELCSNEKTVNIDKLEHDFVVIEISDDSTVLQCTSCKSKKTINSMHTEHDMVYYSSTASSATFKCSECSKTETYSGTFGWKRISGYDTYGITTSKGFFETPAPMGIEGPAGGIIFYDCDADNDKFKNDGFVSSECGWRYLEVSKNYLSMEYGYPTIVEPTKEKFIQGYYRKSSNASNLRVNGSTTYEFANCTVDTLGYGKSNTEKLVNAFLESGKYCYSSISGSGTTDQCAALLCNELSHKNNGYTYSDWFLPSAYELRQAFYVLEDHSEFLNGTTKLETISTSSEKSESTLTLSSVEYNGADVMHNFNSKNMKTSSRTRDTELYVLPMRQVSCPKEV